MQRDWLEEGIRNGGTMVVSRNRHRMKASMYWTHLNKKICGTPEVSLSDALISLNEALHDVASETIVHYDSLKGG